MKKIVSNVLIVSTQLIVGGLFLFMLFSDKTEDNRVVVIENNNLDKMADAVSELFVVDHVVSASKSEEELKKEEELKSAEQKKLEEEAQKKAEEEAARLAQEEEARKAQEEAAAKKAAEEEAARKAAAAASANNTSVQALQAYAYDLVINTYGWSETDFVSLVALWNKESGWSVTAANASGAYGIPQALPGNKMASAGSDWATNGETQIRWGLSYIKSQYGSPSTAWECFQNRGWY